MNNSQQIKLLLSGFGFMFFLLFIIIFQNYFQNPFRGTEGKALRSWLVVEDTEIHEVKKNFNRLLELRGVFVDKTSHIPAFSDSLAQLNKEYPNFDKLMANMYENQSNRKSFESTVNNIGLYTNKLLEIVAETRDLAVDEELKNALLPYEQDLDILREKNKKLERSLQAARQRLPEAIQERDFWKNKAEQIKLTEAQTDSTDLLTVQRIVVLEKEIEQLRTTVGLSQQEITNLNDSLELLIAKNKAVLLEKELIVEEKEQTTKEKEQALKEKENAYKFAPLITIQANRKRIDYDPQIGLNDIKKRKEKQLQIRFEVPSIQLDAMEKQIFGDSYTASVNVHIYKKNGHLALSEQVNLYKGKSSNLYISRLELGEVYRAEILQAGKNVTQNGSFEFKL